MKVIKNKTILLVEDDLITSQLNSETLKNMGYEVVVAYSGKDAQEIGLTNSKIDLILMDIGLGECNEGIDATEEILKHKDIPIVFLSDHSESSMIKKTEKITAYGYIVKGSSDQFLEASIQMALKLFEANQKEKAAREKLEATLNALPDLMFEVGLDGTYFDYHSPYTEMLYKPVSEVIGQKIQDILPADIVEIIFSAMKEANEKGISIGKQFEMTVPAGTLWFELSVSRKGTNQSMPHFIILKRDITERKHSENQIKSLLEEKDLILKEAHHRIKNNMVTMAGLLTLQANMMQDPVAIRALHEASSRMQSMGLLYDRLYRSENIRAISIKQYLEPLVDAILENFSDSINVKVEKNIEDFILHARILQPLGIIMNELLTNIMKYAFIGKTDEKLIIVEASMRNNPNMNAKNALIVVYDNGNGLPESIDFTNSQGFGLTLIRRLTKQLHGNIEIERKNGTKIILEIDMNKDKKEWI